MSDKYIPINKGNYSMESPEREQAFEQFRAEGWEEEYREYRQNWSRYPLKQFVSEYPLLIDAELSSICNLKCPMCYTITDEFKNKVNTGLMDYDLFKRIIDEIGEKVPALRLSLRGEPTLHSRFVDCIKYAKSKGVKEVSFLTNASRLTPDYFEEVLKAGTDWITISFDGLGETYEKVRKPLKFEESYNKIKLIKKIKEQRGTNKPVIKVQAVWPAVRNDPDGYYRAFEPYVDLIAYNPLIDYLGKDEDIIFDENFSCPQLYQRLVIGTDGLTMMCSNDEDNSRVIGDANKETIFDIWHGKKLQAVRDIHKCNNGFKQIDACRKCYLPRKTAETETGIVKGRRFFVKNYVNRKQEIGE